MADTLQSMPMRFHLHLPKTCICNDILFNGRCVPRNGTALVLVIAWNRTGPKLLFKPVVIQFTDPYMAKNKSKNKKTLFKFGTVNNNKTVALISNKC